MKSLNNQTCYDFLKSRTKGIQNKPAIVFENLKYSFGELIETIDLLSKQLTDAAIKEKDICTVILPNSPQLIIAFYAINKIGAIANIFFFNTEEDEIVEKMKLSGSKVIISTDAVVHNFAKIASQVNITVETTRVVKNKLHPFTATAKTKSLLDTKGFPNLLLSPGTKSPTACIMSEQYLLESNKLVILSNKAFNALVSNLNEAIKISDDLHNVLSSFDLFTVSGLALGVHWTLSNGWTCVINRGELCETISRQNVTAMIANVHSVRLLLNSDTSKSTSLIWMLYVVDQAETQENIDSLANRGIKVITALSKAEVCSVYAIMQDNKDAYDHFLPLPNTQMRSIDAPSKNSKCNNYIDEVTIQSPSIMNGYFSNNQMEYNGIHINKHGEMCVHLFNKNTVYSFD